MRYHLLATDFDGTLARDGRVSDSTLESLIGLKSSGRKIVLVTGRELEHLEAIFPAYTIFDIIVAENGAVVYSPSTLKKTLLGKRPPEAFIAQLTDAGLPISIGEVIVASWEPHQEAILEAIKSSGLEQQLIFNKGAIMILPPGVNKATGLHLALRELGISEHNMVAIGDAENDNAMLEASEFGVAVSNAVDQLKKVADLTTTGCAGEGVEELIHRLLATDLAEFDEALCRHRLEMGRLADGGPFSIRPFGRHILVAGDSGCGKTTLIAAFINRLADRKYQYCLIDPEGDYQDLAGAITIGDEHQEPTVANVIKALSQTKDNVIACFLGIPLPERPGYFRKLFSALTALRRNTGHPHFIIIDESHHVLPKDQQIADFFPEELSVIIAVTTQPALLCDTFLKGAGTFLSMGKHPREAISFFLENTGQSVMPAPDHCAEDKDILVWQQGKQRLENIRPNAPEKFLMRHKRKYACGDMSYNSFFFTGPANQLRLMANNLIMFVQMARGVDDQTWLYHLGRHDYSNWLRFSVKDADLAASVRAIETQDADPKSSREAVFSVINRRYTLAG